MKNTSGFSLVELIVSMGIMILLITVVAVNFREGQQFDELRISAQTLTDNLRVMQNRAMTGQVFGVDVPQGGYGVHFAIVGALPNSYFLFADGDADQWYDGAGELFPNGEIAFLKNVRTIAMEIDGSAVSPCANCGVSLTYKPPDATYYVVEKAGPPAKGKVVEVLLQHGTTLQCRRVTANGVSGQVSEEIDSDCLL